MELKNITREDLDILSYTDIAELILKEKNISMNTADIFKTICDILNYSTEEYTEKIGDFYTSLTTDKRFIFLSNNEWDLKIKHSIQIVMEDDDFEEEIEDEIESDLEEDEEEEDSVEELIDDDIDDDLDDLSVIDEEEIDE